MERLLHLRVCSTDGKSGVVITCDGRTVEAAGVKAPLQSNEEQKTLTFHVFIDKSVLEVFADKGRACIAKVIYPPEQDIG
ncbi:MAG: hypothetical protein E4H40_05085, partial [Candidatus Brocadiia bacterium]